ncbi:MAG: ABC transporter permease [Proteobacteria bacterium]|nr:ABC transporter permease [Pseudomonadota bacterium]
MLPFLWSRRDVTLRLALQHLGLTVLAVALAVIVAVPLGIVLTRKTRLVPVVMGGAGVLQTIPSLALLAFMIPVPGLGLGARSAVAALCLYALLPIIRNTYSGIRDVDPDLLEAARGMGLRDRELLAKVELPLATRAIMAGIRTSTVISIGVATLAAFIGAGGLGDPIVTGLQLNDSYLILSGALPAAMLALCADFVLGYVERALIPRGVRT